MDDFERARDFIEGLEESTIPRQEPFEHGRCFFHDDYPVVWDLNFARVEREPSSWTELETEVDELQRAGGLVHRRMQMRDEPWVGALRDEARGRGWEATSLIFMVQSRPSEKENGGRAREVAYGEIRPLRAEVARRAPWSNSEKDVLQVLDGMIAWMRNASARHVVAAVDGKSVAGADLYRGPGLAQIEDVATLEEYRNRGLASDVVLEAAALARADDPGVTVFLVADENDWPKSWYERLGFEAVGRKHSLLKLPK